LYERSIPPEVARRLLRHLRTLPVAVVVDNGREGVTDEPEGYRVRLEAAAVSLGVRVVDDLADSLDFSPGKILITAPGEQLAANLAAITAPFVDDIAFTLSAPFYLEANMIGVSKGDALARVCARLGIDAAEVIAFGDAENDVSMLAFAGRGVAMANASPALKAVADEVTASNNDDGIADALARYFDLPTT
jgi:Cof subfamily protein (haloacid dehalogenase superfamily)